MSKVIEFRGCYKVLATNRDYVVINTTRDYEHHAHFKRLETVKSFISMIEKNQRPHSPYLLKAAKRLLGDEFSQLQERKTKMKYVNHSGRKAT